MRLINPDWLLDRAEEYWEADGSGTRSIVLVKDIELTPAIFSSYVPIDEYVAGKKLVDAGKLQEEIIELWDASLKHPVYGVPVEVIESFPRTTLTISTPVTATTGKRRFTKYPSNYVTASTKGTAISFKAVQAYLSDDAIYDTLNPYEQKILAKAFNSIDFQVYLVSAAETLDLTNVPVSDTFRKVIDIVIENWEF